MNAFFLTQGINARHGKAAIGPQQYRTAGMGLLEFFDKSFQYSFSAMEEWL
jgi:hypothetical protein